ncbi:MAG: M48 family metallopeptidase [Marinospirillum sp.]|uniref:M48 family metallopeptidase n=1 Tax=Marinospirillum sp. TaxID=2183934 RepID=UPI001A0342B0|nr:SprT family zinc-dependent metalloprotease [Marinospirillum sp.]MBE0507159.1 M48 family metallopeptidase [Marinospirillum sp.]
MILTVDDLIIPVRESARRKSLQLTVERDSSLCLTVPPGIGSELLEAFVRSKQPWIYKKLAEKALMQKTIRHKQFVQGEGFLYLGRHHRLHLVEGKQDAPLKLINGRFHLLRDAQPEARQHFIRWYSQRGKAWLWQRAQDFANRLEVNPAGLQVQELGYRWGSCGKGNRLYFHWKTILLPARIAEYVVVHELVHLHEPNHSAEFWLRLERAMPDYEERKQWLAEHGMDVEGL